MAPGPVSPVRIRVTLSTADTQILPSPILPVRAALEMASTTSSATLGCRDDFQLDLGDVLDFVLGTAVDLRVASLAAEALDFGDRHAGDAHKRQGFTDSVKCVWLDNGGYEDH